jgi:hypothetical protein
MNLHWHDLIRVTDFSGVIFNAAIGATIARSRRFDPIGLINSGDHDCPGRRPDPRHRAPTGRTCRALTNPACW